MLEGQEEVVGLGAGRYGEGRSSGGERGGSGKAAKNDTPWRPGIGSSRKKKKKT